MTKHFIPLLVIAIIATFFSSCGFKYLQEPEYYEAGDNILGESMKLGANGEFEYQRWEDHYNEMVFGTYKWKGQNLLLTTDIIQDSMRITERITAGKDSIIVQVEVWDDKFENKLLPMSYVDVNLLKGGDIVASQSPDLGRAVFEAIAFDEVEIIASGFLVRELYQPEHNKSNFFYAQYRFGNEHLEHLHFDDEKWKFQQGKTVESVVEEKNQIYKERLIYMAED